MVEGLGRHSDRDGRVECIYIERECCSRVMGVFYL